MKQKKVTSIFTLATLAAATISQSHATQLDTSTEGQETIPSLSLSNVSSKTTLLHKAVKGDQPLKTIEFLAQEMGDALNAIDENKKTALDYAKTNGPIYRLLVAKGAYRKVDLQLFDIARHGKPKDLECALEQGANLNIKNGDGHTLVQIAKQVANFEMACIFQEKEYEAKLKAQKHSLLTQPKQSLPTHQALMEHFSKQLQVPLKEVTIGIAAEQALVRHAGITREQTGATFRRHATTGHTKFKLKINAAEVLQWLAYYTQHYPGLFQKIQPSTEDWVYISLDTHILYEKVIPKLAKLG